MPNVQCEVDAHVSVISTKVLESQNKPIAKSAKINGLWIFFRQKKKLLINVRDTHQRSALRRNKYEVDGSVSVVHVGDGTVLMVSLSLSKVSS